MPASWRRCSTVLPKVEYKRRHTQEAHDSTRSSWRKFSDPMCPPQPTPRMSISMAQSHASLRVGRGSQKDPFWTGSGHSEVTARRSTSLDSCKTRRQLGRDPNWWPVANACSIISLTARTKIPAGTVSSEITLSSNTVLEEVGPKLHWYNTASHSVRIQATTISVAAMGRSGAPETCNRLKMAALRRFH
jgi:hypothetical protein